MSKTKVSIYSSNGALVGYFVDAKVDCFANSEYELKGDFFGDNDQLANKIEFNPQACPYSADLSALSTLKHKRLKNVYVQSGRQPIKMTGLGV